MTGLGFWRLAAADPQARAVVEADGSVVSRGDLLAQCHRFSRVLREHGLQRGGVVVGVVANDSAALALTLACQQTGAYYVPVNTSLTSAEIGYIVEDTEPVVVITAARHAEIVRDALDAVDFEADRRFAIGPVEGFADLLAAAAEQSPGAPQDRSAGTFMSFTSGTTGRPKGIVRALPEGDPDDAFAAAAQWQLGMFGIEPLADGTHLITSPLSHTAVSGLAVTSLHFGHSVVIMERFDAERMLQLIQEHRVTTTHVVPTQLHRLLRLPDDVRRAYDVSSMRNLVHGAGPCSEEIKRGTIDWFGPVVWEYYGASEAAGTVISSAEWLAKPGSVGRPQPGADVQILRPDGSRLEPGESGPVYLKMGAHAFEYRGAPEKTRQSRIGEYVTVGDLGRLDEDGYLFLLGRTAEVVVTGGVNVYPAEVEAAILTHPDVQDVGVVGLPDPEWGHILCAVVQLVPEPTMVGTDESELDHFRAFLADRLATYKIPRLVRLIDQLPRGANGKLRHRELTSAAEVRKDDS